MGVPISVEEDEVVLRGLERQSAGHYSAQEVLAIGSRIAMEQEDVRMSAAPPTSWSYSRRSTYVRSSGSDDKPSPRATRGRVA
jgi:hypothetical protein